MPTRTHEEIVELLSKAPSAAVEVLAATGKVVLPRYASISVEAGSIRQLVSPALNVDVVVSLKDEEDKIVFISIVEVQFSIDTDKLWTWPEYQPRLRREFKCPCCLIVLALNDEVESWATQAIFTGQPGSPFFPLVTRPRQFPKVTDQEEANKEPYRAILSAILHGDEPGAEHLALIAAKAAESLPAADRDMWLELMGQALNEISRKALEAMMNIDTYKQTSVWCKEAKLEGKREGKLEERIELLTTQFAFRLNRSLDPSELANLATRVQKEGPEPSSKAVLSLSPEQLEQWLAAVPGLSLRVMTTDL